MEVKDTPLAIKNANADACSHSLGSKVYLATPVGCSTMIWRLQTLPRMETSYATFLQGAFQQTRLHVDLNGVTSSQAFHSTR
jgi:hypothetical protein